MPVVSCSRVNSLLTLPQVTLARGASRFVTFSVRRFRSSLNGRKGRMLRVLPLDLPSPSKQNGQRVLSSSTVPAAPPTTLWPPSAVGFAREIDRDLADVAVHAQPLQKGVGHDQLPVRAGMKAVAAADVVFRAEDFLGLLHRLDHRIVDVGEPLLVFFGQSAVDVAEMGQVVVVGDVRRLVCPSVGRGGRSFDRPHRASRRRPSSRRAFPGPPAPAACSSRRSCRSARYTAGSCRRSCRSRA